ncbi:uncharacterized protein LOC129721193 [Wyeomyia smithii]|uniref:uncharacterized protein LOC129721193 n=1 Tax=Wyeomyia smithii TaxID=174621 RepID=UPI002467ACB4|nr:uncharacterized protein LOC129721193 [Wyeomyia smithii]
MLKFSLCRSLLKVRTYQFAVQSKFNTKFTCKNSDHKTKNESEIVKQEPIKYFGSPTARWKAEHTRSGPINEHAPWYQPYVVIASVSVFLIYFCILREENNIDRDLERSLYDHIPWLEHKQLVLNYHYNKENGLSTIEIEQRMKELGIEIN